MATIQAEVNKFNKRKDGTIPVQIRVTHKRKFARLRTNLIAYPEDLTREGKLKGNLKRKADRLVSDMYDALETISYFDLQNGDVNFVATYIKKHLSKEDWHLDFFEFADTFLQDAHITESTKHTYQVALSALARYVGKRELDINEISLPFLQDFAVFLANEPKKYFSKKQGKLITTKKAKRTGTGDRVYFAKLSTIFNAAKKRYNDEDMGDIRIPRSPFEKITVAASPSEGQDPLPLSTIRLIIQAEPRLQAERDALDLFLLSLGLMGANIADLYEAVPPVGGIWGYERKKTSGRRSDRAEMKVRIPDCVTPYLTRLSAGASPDRWLNLSNRFANANYATKSTNANLKAWAKNNGLPEFTFYAARKTWATIAHSKECGIEKALIDECLAHVGDYRIADIYIQRDWQRIWDANEKVCSLIWPSPTLQ